MADFFTTEKRTLGVVLSNTTPPLRVPDYQRDFSWETRQVAEFWADLELFDSQYPGANINGKEYFLGAAVFVNNATYNLILDGQQRLATATILLAALRDKIREYNLDAANQIQSSYISFHDHLGGDRLPKLQLNEFDRAYFRDAVQAFPPTAVVASKKSHRLIAKAYEYFVERINERWNERSGGENAFRWAARISKTLTDHISLVTVVSTDEDHAASIFETLNDRGIGLSAADLLRSWLMHHSPPAQRDQIVEYWSDIFESVGIGEGAETLIRLSWISRYGDVKERSLYKVISHKLHADRTDSVNYSGQLRADALFYRRVKDGDVADLRQRDIWLGIATLKAHSAYALLMAANRVLPDDSQRRICAALFSLIIRHNVICDKDRARFESAAFATAKSLSDGGGEERALTLLRELSPTDQEVRESFSTLSFSRAQSGIAQLMLRSIEYELRNTEELIIATPERVHLEHIYPQRPPAADRWANHDQYVGRIGNLTLLSRRLNQEAQNLGFPAKKEQFYSQSDLYLTKELLSRDSWADSDIDYRQRHLCDIAVRIWPQGLLAS